MVIIFQVQNSIVSAVRRMFLLGDWKVSPVFDGAGLIFCAALYYFSLFSVSFFYWLYDLLKALKAIVTACTNNYNSLGRH